jgi:serine protease DegS
MRMRKLLFSFYIAIVSGLTSGLVTVLLIPDALDREPVLQGSKGAAVTRIRPGDSSANLDMGPVSYARAVRLASPAVINIYTTKHSGTRTGPWSDDPSLEPFLRERSLLPRNNPETNLGSGVIVSREGFILTNNHVIQGADEIRVTLQDGRETLAEVVGYDEDTDLAVLDIDLDNLPFVNFATRKGLKVGDVVLAIGNPFGVGQTVTMGIVSATGRSRLGLNTFEDFIQTDAAINPGNSGGALIDAYGNLVGINTAIYASGLGGSRGIGFAIPCTLAKEVFREIIEQGYVTRGWLGIEVRELSSEVTQSLALGEQTGVVISRVIQKSPADFAGLVPGDIVTRVDSHILDDPYKAVNTIARIRPGEPVKLEVLREGRRYSMTAVVSQRPLQDVPGP